MDTSSQNEPGEDMNVRLVHAAIWREMAEPSERRRGLPWYLRRMYAVMFILGAIYLLSQAFDWNEYEDSTRARMLRDMERQKVMEQQRAAANSQGARS